MTYRAQLFLDRIKDKLRSFFVVVLKFLTPRNRKLLIVLVAVVAAGLLMAIPAYAIFDQLGKAIGYLLAHILYYIAYAFGWLAMMIFQGIIFISQYSDFVTSKAVTKGWVLIRDMCNMLLVILLLVYAFATILRIKKYSEERFLPRILIAAVLINFSKLFAGLVIDAGQVFMMTFVNGYAASAGANLIVGLNITKVMSFKIETSETLSDFYDLFLYLFFAIVYLAVTIMVTLMIFVTLGMRIVMLWILVVVSPFGFLGISQFPRVTEYTNKWWDLFINWVLVGPILAFFIWLSLLMMADPGNMVPAGQGQEFKKACQAQGGCKDTTTGIMDFNNFISSVLGLTMLYAASKFAKKIADSASPLAASMVGKAGAMGARITGAAAIKGTYEAYRGKAEAKRKEGYGRAAESLFAAREKAVGAGKKALYAAPLAVQAVGKTVVQALPKAAAAMRKEGRAGWEEAKAKGITGVGGVAAKASNALVTGLVGAGKGFFASLAVGGYQNIRAVPARVRMAGWREQAVASDRSKKKMDEADKKFKQSGLYNDTNQMARILETGTAEERAAVLKQAIAKKQLDKVAKPEDLQGIVNEVKGKLNIQLQGELDETLIKSGNGDLAYDTSTTAGLKNFTEAVENGEVDGSNLTERMLKNQLAMQIMFDALGAKNFAAKMENAAGKNEKMKEVVMQSVRMGFERKILNDDGTENKEKTQEAQKSNRTIHASLSGNLAQSFGTLNQATGKYDINVGSSEHKWMIEHVTKLSADKAGKLEVEPKNASDQAKNVMDQAVARNLSLASHLPGVTRENPEQAQKLVEAAIRGFADATPEAHGGLSEADRERLAKQFAVLSTRDSTAGQFDELIGKNKDFEKRVNAAIAKKNKDKSGGAGGGTP